MFTILWKIPGGTEEIYSTYGVCHVPALKVAGEYADCSGKAHIVFQRLTAVQDQEHLQLHRTFIDCGTVFVMNSEGKTVATYRF